MPIKTMIADAKQRMHASVETVRRELSTMRTGRASLSILDGDPGGLLRHAHARSTRWATSRRPTPRSSPSSPGTPRSSPAIEKAIRGSDLDLNPAERRQDHPHPHPSAHRGAPQDAREERAQARRGGPGGHPQRAARRQRPPEEAAQGPRGQRGRREARDGRGPEADRPAHRADQRRPQEEGSARSWKSDGLAEAPYNPPCPSPTSTARAATAATRPGQVLQPLRVRRPALRALRPRAGGPATCARATSPCARPPSGATTTSCPVENPDHRISLGEGFTPLLSAPQPGRGRRPSPPLHQGRGRQPHRLLQGARPRPRRVHGQGAGRHATSASLPRGTRAARSPPTPPAAASGATSSCRATSPGSS